MTTPLYSILDGQGDLLLCGIFDLQDTHGFPIDASFEEAKMRGARIDWLEAMCTCWLNDPLKFDSFERQASSLVGFDLMEKWCAYGAMFAAQNPDVAAFPNPVDEICRRTIAAKKAQAINLVRKSAD